MPGFRGHLIGGAVVYLVLLHATFIIQPLNSAVASGFIFCLLGSLFPDVDIKSKGQQIFYIGILFALCFFLLFERFDLFISVSLFAVIPLLVKHRGIFHNPWFLLCIAFIPSLCLMILYKAYSIWIWQNSCFFLAGAWSHVFLDRVITRLKYWVS